MTEITVRAGSTASELAQAYRPAGVSLDQMLVAMLRANPHAFISGNVNRMRAGAVMELPDQAAAQATSIREARQIVAAQSQDFNRYRRQLAAAAPAAAVTAAQRSASGTVEAQVEDRKPTTAAPDKLTLSKGALADERLAREKQAQSQSDRLAELSRNLNELQNVAGAALRLHRHRAYRHRAYRHRAQRHRAQRRRVPHRLASRRRACRPPRPRPSQRLQSPWPTALRRLKLHPRQCPPRPLRNLSRPPLPLPPVLPTPRARIRRCRSPAPACWPCCWAMPATANTGAAARRIRQRIRCRATLPRDAVPGQQADTAQTQFGAELAHSQDQLDTGAETDPLVEADGYLAYGRDLQAEEVLKEALRTQPERLALHQRLADIHVKRHDRKAFEAVAQTVFALTQGQGAEWLHLAEQGRALDPSNPCTKPRPPRCPPARQMRWLCRSASIPTTALSCNPWRRRPRWRPRQRPLPAPNPRRLPARTWIWGWICRPTRALRLPPTWGLSRWSRWSPSHPWSR
ncbi:FimV family protein [Comamonas endophytica]|uniref:type IV pilus assembly protein FimV n=1 Tax=Comamonas endophytica TaxID=2949090 RepID=UPI00360DA4C4